MTASSTATPEVSVRAAVLPQAFLDQLYRKPEPGELKRWSDLFVAADESWRAAWSFAHRTGTKLIPKDERKKIDQIVRLLKLARDGGGSEHERSVAYERASKLIGELHFVRIPEAARKAIGAEQRLMIEAPLANDGAQRLTIA